MAQAPAKSIPPVIKELLEHPQRFTFAQVVRLLRLWAGPRDSGELESFLNNNLRFRPALSLAFAVSDVAGLDVEFSRSSREGDLPFNKALITATFSGLYGPSTPLPKFYTERLLDEQAEDGSVRRDFLDIFNNQFFLLHTLLSSYIEPLQKHLSGYDPDTGRMLMALASFGDSSLCGQLPDRRIFMRYSGFFFQKIRTSSGLRAMLADASGCAATRINCNELRLAVIPAVQRLRLGASCASLGDDAVLGDAVPCYEGKISIEFNELTEETFRRLLPGSLTADILHSLIRNYCRQPLEYSVTVRLLPGEVQALCLGGNSSGRFAFLGLDCWLGVGGLDPATPLPSVQADFMGGFRNNNDYAAI